MTEPKTLDELWKENGEKPGLRVGAEMNPRPKTRQGKTRACYARLYLRSTLFECRPQLVKEFE